MVIRELEILVDAKTKEAIDNLRKTEQQTHSLKDGISKLGKAAVTGLAALGAAFVGVGTAALTTYAAYEQQEIALTKLVGSAEDAQILLSDIQDWAASTPFQMEGLIGGTQRLLAFGTGVDDVIQKMTNLGNASMGNQAVLDRLVNAYGKLQAKGKATLEELNMFTEAGVPIVQALADKFGVTTQEILDMVSKGKVGFEDVDEAITNLTTGTGQFAGMVEEQSKSLSGLFSTFKDNINLVLMDIGEELAPIIKEILGDATEWVQENKQQIVEFGKNIIDVLQIVTGLVATFLELDSSAQNAIVTFGLLGATLAAALGPLGLLVAGFSAAVVATGGITENTKFLEMHLEKMARAGKLTAAEFNKIVEASGLTREEVESIALGNALVRDIIIEQKELQAEINQKGLEAAEILMEELDLRLLMNEAMGFFLGDIITRLEDSRQSVQDLKKELEDIEVGGDGGEEETESLDRYSTKLEEVRRGHIRNQEAFEIMNNEIISGMAGQVAAVEEANDQEISSADEKARALAEITGSEYQTFLLDLEERSNKYKEILGEDFDQEKYVADEIAEYRKQKNEEALQAALDSLGSYMSQIESTFSSVMGLVGMYYDNQIAEINNERKEKEDALEEEKEAKKEQLEETLTDEEELKSALELLDQEYTQREAALDEEYDKKEKELKEKAWKADKAAKITQTIMATAQGIMQAYAHMGPISASIAAAIIAGIGSAKVALIARQPMPKYAEGGDFLTQGPMPIMVGDNPGGVERVQVTPISSPNVNGPQETGTIIHIENITIHGVENVAQLIAELKRIQRKERVIY